MVSSCEVENSKYKLLGFENNKSFAVVMIMSTGKIIKVKLGALLKSEIIDDFSRAEIKVVCKKYYSGCPAVTTYDISDRNERSWMVYVALNLLLFALYVFANVASAKLVYVELFDIVVTPRVFLYPLTFLIVDMLNEFYGMRLARKAILFAFASNALITILLSITGYLPGLAGWELDSPYGEVMAHVSSALVASSVSFIFSEYLNSYLLNKIKELTCSRFLFLRVFLSTFFAVVIDSFIFCFVLFSGKMSNTEIFNIVCIQIAIKMCFAVFNVLPAYGARALFKRYTAGGPGA